MKNKNDFSFLISSFLTNYLTNARNLSPNTVISYRDSIVFLLSYMNDVCNIKPEKLKISDLSAERIKNFLTWLEEEKCCTIKNKESQAGCDTLFIPIYIPAKTGIHISGSTDTCDTRKKNKPTNSTLSSVC